MPSRASSGASSEHRPPTTAPQADVAFYQALVEDDPEDLYEHAPCAYLSSLPDGTIVKANATFLSWTGYDRDAFVGRRRFQELLAPGDRIFYETHFAPALRMQGQVREIAVELVTTAGQRLPVLVNAVLERGPDGEPRVVRTVIFDARERRSYEAELVAARRRAEESEARARDLAATLQSSLLPPLAPSIPGLDVAGAYRPSGDGTEVGGDFYDVFETSAETWGIMLGDVCGKGPAAAAMTAVARYTILAAGLRAASPAAVLQTVHEALLQQQRDRFCTAVYMTVQRSSGSEWTATLACAGHERPLRIDAHGTVDRIGRYGRILGMVSSQHRSTDVSVVLRPGDRVVLYTDGVTDARRDSELFGSGRLIDLLASTPAAADARQTADAIVDAAVEFQDGRTVDDIAVVVLSVPRAEQPGSAGPG